MRKEILLNENWMFYRGDIPVQQPYWKGPVYIQSKTERKLTGPAAYLYNDGSDQYAAPVGVLNHMRWEVVNVPHDYIVDQDLSEDENNAMGYLHYDNAWYRKHFLMPDGMEGKRVTLRFDGVAGMSTIYLNGCLIGHNYSRYNTFEIEVSDYINYDKENVLAVYVNTEEFEGWWYQGGGIYRDVHLTITDPVAIDLWGVYAPANKCSETEWEINFETTVVNQSYEDVMVKALSTLIAPDGSTVGIAEGSGFVELREKGVLRYSMTVENPDLWDCDHPNLYQIETKLYQWTDVIGNTAEDGQERKCQNIETESEPVEIDWNNTRIGFRTVEVSVENGLLLNGKKTFIHGVCSHQDYGLTGLAVPDNVARYKVSLMKEMGANGYRTSHYQQTESYMDAFDEMGFLVMDEARWFESTRESFEQMDALIKRDRNRPSVIMWSTGNEEPFFIEEQGGRINKAIAAHIRKLDNTRLITAAESHDPVKSTIFGECDVIGINYNLNLYEQVHNQYPDKPVFASECCATGTTRDWNFASSGDCRIRDKDRDTNKWFLARENTMKMLHSRPYVFGAYQWAAVEHRGEAAWPAICSKSGAIDLFLLKKGAFYQNQSHWTEKPMAHIVPHWNFAGMEGQDILVTVYTNCEELELFLNGVSLGRKPIEKYGHGEWNVPYVKGELTVKGYVNGVEMVSDTRRTTGKPHALKLTLQNDFEANGIDLAIFHCECVDEDGNIIPDAAEYVRFSVSEPAVIVGTGSDHCDHNRVGLAERQMYMGKIAVAVRPAKGQKDLELMAQSDNCRIGILRMKL